MWKWNHLRNCWYTFDGYCFGRKIICYSLHNYNIPKKETAAKKRTMIHFQLNCCKAIIRISNTLHRLL